MCCPLRKRGLSLMTDTDQLNEVNPELVDEIVKRIPKHTWEIVKILLINYILDQMPSDILIQLTGDPEGYEDAEFILSDYYEDPKSYPLLIKDSIQLFGEESILILLEGMQLDKVPQL
jgi:hypothetical protein